MKGFFNRIENYKYNAALSILAILFVFFLDSITHPGTAVWILYIIPLLMNPFKSLSKPRIYLTALFITVLLWFSFFQDAPGMPAPVAFANRAIMTLILWVIIYVQLQRSDAHKKLIASEENLQLAQSAAHIGSYEVNFVTGRVYWSKETFEIFERNIKDGFPTYDEVVKYIHPDDISGFRKSVDEAIKKNSSFDAEFRIITKSGKIKILSFSGLTYLDTSGNPVSRIGTFMDITERKQIQLKLEHSNEELKQFAYVASHDLQEPLRMISSYITLLGKKYQHLLDDKAKDYISFAVDGSRRMSNLINDLLTYSRLTTHAKELKEVDLNEVCSEVVRDLGVLIREKGAIVEAGNLPVLKADSIQMHQLLQNLIANAIKFHSERVPQICVNAEKINDGYLFSVKDNGIGIEAECFERIFQVFQRLHEQDKYPGTGIGLAVCKKIVEHHGGRIWLESEIGKGTTFYFTIPEHNTLS